jgi:hypothetical protein
MELIANTSVGQFSRNTNSNYKFIVVRESNRAKEAYCLYHNNNYRSSLATEKRWVKDSGFAVTWHGSLESATNSALKPYAWDKETSFVGIFQVEGN